MKSLSCPYLVLWLALALLLSAFAACTSEAPEVPYPANAIYYWRSELKLSAGERHFLRRQQVGKVYLHLFDVVRQGGRLMPSTTLTVTDTLPGGLKVIPVVFLNHNIMADTTGLASLPQLLARRVKAMMEQNQLGSFDELQIDFDWTRRNQTLYFEFLQRLREALRQQGSPVVLSSTIRLHQLGMEAPPADYGALMVYNLGRIQDDKEPNSILTEELFRTYSRYLKGYSLPLCTALPIYSWDLLFHDEEFRCILRGADLSDTTRFQPVDATHYLAVSYHPVPPNGVSLRSDGRIFPGDIIRHEFVPYEVLHNVRQGIARLRPASCRQIILYHLDEKQIKQYSDEELQSLYSNP